ncbi:MAG: hypothetical protein M1358_16275 [Chloroflexi bacterium]|nr:hypothetical protein [Chloroflexota bacterium]
MDLEAGFEALWRRFQDFELPDEEPRRCVFAQEFFRWTSQLCLGVAQDPSIVCVNQAKILLLDRYFEWRSFAPKSHRNRLGTNGHNCIFQVFSETYERLKVVELSLTPPMLFLPSPPPPAPAPPQIAGIFIGEAEEGRRV